MQDKILTISVAAYNSASYISRCIESLVVDSVLAFFDIIIVNDGSTDNTLEIAKMYQQKYPDTIRVIDKDNGGHGSTINASLQIARGKYYKIVDSDDWVEQDGFVRLVQLLKQINADMVINPYNLVDPATEEKERVSLIDDKRIESEVVYPLDSLPDAFDIAMHAVTFRTEVLWLSHFYIDEHCFYVDQEYILYPIRNVYSFCSCSFPVYDYLYGSSEQSCNRKNMINRIDEHTHVCNQVLGCYKENDYNSSQKIIVLNRLAKLIMVEYFLLIDIGGDKGKDALMNIDLDLKSNASDVYYHLMSYSLVKDRIILRMLRLTKYKTFGLLCRIRRLKNKSRGNNGNW